MARLATVYGGSGFVGRYVVQRLAHEGWRVRVAVRRPNEALFVRAYGDVGQVEPVPCNIRDDESVARVMEGAEAVVNCVGILIEEGRNCFEAVQNEGAERIARIASEKGVKSLVHLSALGADENSPSNYARTKALGEKAVLRHFPQAMILRPSVIFGPEDHFFNRFADMAKFGPVLPIVGGKTRFQPVFVDDVAAAAEMGAEGKASGIYELGGPEVDTLRNIIAKMLKMINRRRLILNLPFWMGSVIGFVFDMAQAVSMGLFTNTILTRDQVRLLRHDVVVGEGARTLQDIGITPAAFEAIVPEYLWRFRPDGQYDEIKQSMLWLRKLRRI